MRIYGGNLIKQKLCLIDPEKNIAMLQLNHRNASLVHSHIAVLQFAFFYPTHRSVFSPHPINDEPIGRIKYAILF